MKTEAPDWFRRAVADGLKVLVALSLPGEPALDLMPATKRLWVHLLWNCNRAWQPDDAARVLEAFTVLATRIDRWPAPRQLLDALPRRPRPQPALPAPKADPEKARRYIEQMRRMLRGVDA
jgi:hypothetical protein